MMKLLNRINGYFFDDSEFHLDYLFLYIPVIIMLVVSFIVLWKWFS